MRHKVIAAFAVPVVSIVLAAGSSAAFASHSWGSYHWARQSDPFTLRLGDNLSAGWKQYLQTASADWNTHFSPYATDLLTTIVAGQATTKQCRPTSGRVQVCNATYGNNGWLGVAQIWASGSHITQGSVKLNDSYFNTAAYNTPGWRHMVACQEIGHTFGLDHQDTTFGNANLGTCMDYTNDPDGRLRAELSNEHPNAHDYEELEIIYLHLDSTTTVAAATAAAAMPPAVANLDLDTPRQWGRLVRSTHNGRTQAYERDVGGGSKVFTFVIWADDDPGHRRQ